MLGILIFGLMGIIAVEGVTGINNAGTESQVIQFLRMDELSLQLQITLLACIATLVLTARTFLTLLFFRKFYIFLARKSASVAKLSFGNLLRTSLDVFEKHSVQTWLHAINKGINLLYTKTMPALISILVDSTLIFIIIFGIITYNYIIGVLTIIFFGLVALASTIVSSRHMGTLSEKDLIHETLLTQDFREILDGFKEFDRNPNIQSRINLIGDGWSAQSRNAAKMTLIPVLNKYIFESSVLIGLLGFAGASFVIFDAKEAFASLTVFLISSTRIVPTIARIQTNVNTLSSTSAAIKVLRKIEKMLPLNMSTEILQTNEHKTRYQCLDIVIDGIEFHRDNFRLVVPSMKIEQGEKIAVVGHSGSGKTTLLDLFAGLRGPTRGEITINGMELGRFRNRFGDHVGYVSQDVALIRGNLRTNLLLNPSNITDEEVIQILVELGLWSRFEPQNGLEADVVGLHRELSGGERQRLGIARALVQNPKYLVMDEFSSSLDEESTKRALEAIMGRRNLTVIASTHNPMVIKYFDKILEVVNGVVNLRKNSDTIRSSVFLE